MRFALIGQPNCGKSTLFNQVAGYKAETGNFSGTTVTFTESKVRLSGKVIELVDLPGTFTLHGTNPAEAEVLKYINSHAVDAIINVVDATHLTQGLELTLELLSVDRPIVVAMNMLDEASRMGLTIDGPALMTRLGVPVMPLVASRGHGIKALFLKTDQAAQAAIPKRDPSLLVENDLHRHQLAGELAGMMVTQGPRRVSWRDRLDDILLHPVWGFLALVVILFIFFQLVYGFGKLIEAPVLAIFNAISSQVASFRNEHLIRRIDGWLDPGRGRWYCHRAALPDSIPVWVKHPGRRRLPAAHRFPDGWIDASPGFAWQSHRTFHFGVWL